ncbi:MAG: hypothetical protein E7276_01930 [Pseudobutyrivibrio sp.]|nr:hypothetical protein [Pseudobutyrivibrio sp.]
MIYRQQIFQEEYMRRLINNKLIGAKIKMNNAVKAFKEDNRGVSGIVAAVILVLIAVLLAALFWGKLQEWFNSTWGNVTETTNEIK